MKKNTLLSFDNPMEYIKYVRQFDIFSSWRIETGLMNDRGNVIADSEYCNQVRSIFQKKQIFHKKVSVSEMATWLDTFVHMERLMKILIANYDISILNEIEIGFEYVIKLSKKSRVDYYIKYRENVCLIEFSTVKSFSRLSTAHHKKRNELLAYKDMIHNYISNKRILIYPFIGLPEYSNDHKREKFILNNKNNITHMYNFLKAFILI